MLLESHVILAIQCSDAGDAATISSHLGVQPTRVVEHRPRVRQANGEMMVTPFYAWTLDSPTPAEEGDPTARLWGLVELIRPFGDRLVTLDPKWVRYIDIWYRLTPQEPSGLTVEFAWFRVPAKMMKPLAEWGLDVSYEVFWYPHPDRRPTQAG